MRVTPLTFFLYLSSIVVFLPATTSYLIVYVLVLATKI